MQLSFSSLKQITSFKTNTIGPQITVLLIESETTQIIKKKKGKKNIFLVAVRCEAFQR